MKNTNKSKRYLINASYGACAEAEQFFLTAGRMFYPVRISMRLQVRGRRIDKDNGVKLRIHNGTQTNFRIVMSR